MEARVLDCHRGSECRCRQTTAVRLCDLRFLKAPKSCCLVFSTPSTTGDCGEGDLQCSVRGSVFALGVAQFRLVLEVCLAVLTLTALRRGSGTAGRSQDFIVPQWDQWQWVASPSLQAVLSSFGGGGGVRVYRNTDNCCPTRRRLASCGRLWWSVRGPLPHVFICVILTSCHSAFWLDVLASSVKAFFGQVFDESGDSLSVPRCIRLPVIYSDSLRTINDVSF